MVLIIYIYKIIMLYTQNLYNVIYQFYLNEMKNYITKLKKHILFI